MASTLVKCVQDTDKDSQNGWVEEAKSLISKTVVSTNHWVSASLFFLFLKLNLFPLFFFFAFYWWTYVISNWIYARMTIGQTHCGLFLFSPSGLWTRPVAGGSISNPRRGRDRKMTSILNCAVGEKRNEESRNPSWKETWQQYIYIYI